MSSPTSTIKPFSRSVADKATTHVRDALEDFHGQEDMGYTNLVSGQQGKFSMKEALSMVDMKVKMEGETSTLVTPLTASPSVSHECEAGSRTFETYRSNVKNLESLGDRPKVVVSRRKGNEMKRFDLTEENMARFQATPQGQSLRLKATVKLEMKTPISDSESQNKAEKDEAGTKKCKAKQRRGNNEKGPCTDESVDPTASSSTGTWYGLLPRGASSDYYIPHTAETEELLWIRKNLMSLVMALGRLIRDSNVKAAAEGREAIAISHNQEFYSTIRPNLFHYKNILDAKIADQNPNFVADELPPGFLRTANDKRRKVLSAKDYKKRNESEKWDPWQCLDIRQLQYCLEAAFEYAVFLKCPEINKRCEGRVGHFCDYKCETYDQELLEPLAWFEKSLQSMRSSEDHLNELHPTAEQALQGFGNAKAEAMIGVKLLEKYMKEKQGIDRATESTTAKKGRIERKGGLLFPYYNAIEEGKTEVAEFIVTSYGIPAFVYDICLIMASSSNVADDKLPPNFRDLWKKPPEQGCAAAEFYEKALSTKKARMAQQLGAKVPQESEIEKENLMKIIEKQKVSNVRPANQLRLLISKKSASQTRRRKQNPSVEAELEWDIIGEELMKKYEKEEIIKVGLDGQVACDGDMSCFCQLRKVEDS